MEQSKVDFSHRLVTPLSGDFDEISMVDSVVHMTGRAKGILEILSSHLLENGTQLDNVSMHYIVQSVYCEVQDIDAVVNAYYDAIKKPSD